MSNQMMGKPVTSRIALIGFVVALLGLLALVVAPFGYRYGVWSLTVSLQVLMAYGAYAALAGAILSLIGLGRTWPGSGRRGFALSLVGIIAGAGTAYVVHDYYMTVKTVPFIHDITTDTEDPPQFSAVVPAREAAGANPHVYAGPELAAKQKYGYPDLDTLTTTEDPAAAFRAALAVAEEMGWEIVDQNPDLGRIEATATSFWYQFKDDIVIRIRPASDGSGSEIDMRSLSRVGRSDVGVNAARIRETFAALDGRLNSS